MYYLLMFTLFAQVPLFLICIIGCVTLLRAIPYLRPHAPHPHRWLLLLAAFAAPAASVTIGILGHDFYEERDIAFSASTTFLLAAGLALLWISRRYDPARNRRRCPSCWYDLSGAPNTQTPTCPECGCVIKRVRDLTRTRRSTFLAAASIIVLLLSYVALKAPRVSEYGWGIFIPSTPMIVALPSLPSSMVEPADTPMWSLDDRYYDLWPWQGSLLTWRANRVISRSADLDALSNAEHFADENAKYSDAALVKLIRADISGTDVTISFEHLPEEFQHRESQDQILPKIQQALRSGNERQAQTAARYVPYAKAHASELADSISHRLDQKEERAISTLIISLALLADHNDHAWHQYLRRITDPDPLIRRYAVRITPFIRSQEEVILPLLEQALDDPNDDVAIGAVKAMAFRAPHFLTLRDRLLTIARARPVVGSNIIWELCRADDSHPEVIALLRERLQSRDADQLDMTLGAIALLEHRAAPLHPDLKAFAATPAAKLTSPRINISARLAEAMQAIDEGNENTEATE